jgi:hypothetical protein
MRIAGFNDRGEARIVNDHGELVGYGDLRLPDAHITGIDTGDRISLDVVITWTREMPDPDAMDFDDLDWQSLLPDS